MYELLCGRSPYRLVKGTSQEIADAVRSSEPQRLSVAVLRTQDGDNRQVSSFDPQDCAVARDTTPVKLNKRLRGDLDNIIMMALRKEPKRRYPSVEQLAGDVARYLDNLPVAASRGTARYRTAKFVARHRGGVLAATAVMVTLLAGIALTLHEARIAGAERERAEQRFRDMRELARSNLFEFHDAIQNLPGSASARNLVIQRALGYLDKLSRDEAGDRGTEGFSARIAMVLGSLASIGNLSLRRWR